MNPLRYATTVLVLLTSSTFTFAQAPPLWGKLSPGPHGVGFTSFWELDYSRSYHMTFADKSTYATGKAPRPILINLWYPATKQSDTKTMTHREYLTIGTDDARLTKFAEQLAEYERGIITQEIMGKPAKELTQAEKVSLNRFLDSPTASVRDASPAQGKFPLVIYHAGYGSSFEDNAVLCEYLASHGYVVLGSAYQEPSGTTFNIDGQFTSARDMEFLIAHARQLTGVDWNHVGVVGHSGGAHAALAFRAQANSAVDAVVSLDTTQDYYNIADPRWEYLTTTVTKNRKHMTCPILFAANPHAFFALADSLKNAPRYYLTLKELGHNDFIAQGVIHQEAAGKEKAKAVTIRTAYEPLCIYVLHFLNATLKGDEASKAFLATQYRDTKLGGKEPHVEFVPPGSDSPEPYVGTEAQPPTPRQLRPYLRTHGTEKTLELLKRFKQSEPAAPINHHVFGLALADDMVEQGKLRDAQTFREYFRVGKTDCVAWWLIYGDLYAQHGKKMMAAHYFKRVLLLEPDHAQARQKLKDLGTLDNEP